MASDRPLWRILVVDDVPAVRMGVALALQHLGAKVAAAPDPAAGLEAVRLQAFDIVVSDIRMPGMDGHEFLRRLKALAPEVDVVMMTAFATVDGAVSAMREGAADFLEKPFTLEQLRQKLARICERRRLRAGNDFAQTCQTLAVGAPDGP